MLQRNPRLPRLLGPLAALLASTSLGAPAAHAQEAVTLDRFTPGPTGDDAFALSRATDLGHLLWSIALHGSYANDPLVYRLRSGDGSETRVVSDHLNFTVGAALGLWDRLVLFAALPVTAIMDGDPATPDGVLADGAGLGNAQLGARVRLIGDPGDWGALALQVTGAFPTAGSQRFRGEDGVSLRPELLAEFRIAHHLRLNARIGAQLRRSVADARNLSFSDELTFGLGATVPLALGADAGRTLELHAQVFGNTAFDDAFGRDQSALEALLGAKYFDPSGFVAGLAAGPGVLPGFGSPDFRVVAMVAFQTPREVAAATGPVRSDRDRDGVFDDEDGCPDEAGPAANRGCPWGDRDGDGVVDPDDGCPDEAGPVANRGCPWGDSDGDGIRDNEDGCPTEAGPVENRGCPWPDRDGDGIADRRDNCPDEPGPVENQGCPQKQQVKIEDGRLEIIDIVYFKFNSDVIETRSHGLLNNVAQVLNAHPEIERVRVEGHTDNRGGRDYNIKLSQRRAESVRRFLIEKGGVAADRLDAKGFGPDVPIVPKAKTKEDHGRNRRVEFNIIGGDGGVEQRRSGPGSETIDR